MQFPPYKYQNINNIQIIDIQAAQEDLNFSNQKIQRLELELKKETIIFLNRFDPDFKKIDDRYITIERLKEIIVDQLAPK